MLRSLAIQNFKPFGALQKIPLAPVTLIYGPNSSGKSSLIQALLMLKQSLIDTISDVVQLMPRGEFIDLGSFRSLLHRHELQRRLLISVGYTSEIIGWNQSRHSARPHFRGINRQITLQFGASEESKVLNPVAELLSVQFAIDESLRVRLKRSAMQEDLEALGMVGPQTLFEWSDDQSIDSFIRFCLEKNRQASLFADRDSLLESVRRWRFVSRGSLPSRLIPLGENADELLRSQEVRLLRGPFNPLETLTSELGILLRNTLHLGPLRSYPERHYVSTGTERNYVGDAGEFTTQAIFLRSDEITDAINLWFSEFEIPYSMAVRSYGDPVIGELIALHLKDRASEVLVAPSDVGFGIGQLLPIIVQGLISKGQTICVEQPEIHLHPRLQAHIADFLIDTSAINKRPRVEAPQVAPHPNQWIVETHSESLILRLQRRIREKDIRAEDICILYVLQTDEGDSQVRVLRLDENGDFLDEWPGGFFEEAFDEVIGGRHL